MASTKELRSQIRSIKSTQKITSAMEMVAASKMRKAQERMHTARPYATRILQVIGHLARGKLEYHHPYLEARPITRAGIIVVTSDRGLCGGLNINLFKKLVQAMTGLREKGADIDLCVMGGKGKAFFKRHGGNIIASLGQLGDAPHINDLIGVVKVMLDAYDAKKIDALYIAHNIFVSTMVQQPHIQQLLPLVPSEDKLEQQDWDYIYEPDARELLTILLKRYIESQVYRGVVENLACFQAAQMVAMKNASDNAGTLIDELQLDYNKARQASITQELAEIVAGAAAV